MFITITGAEHYVGMDVFRIHQIVQLEKEENNPEDEEAICVKIEGGAIVGYVANSLYTKVKGTYSAGYIHHSFSTTAKAKVRFITNSCVIAEICEQDSSC